MDKRITGLVLGKLTAVEQERIRVEYLTEEEEK